MTIGSDGTLFSVFDDLEGGAYIQSISPSGEVIRFLSDLPANYKALNYFDNQRFYVASTPSVSR